MKRLLKWYELLFLNSYQLGLSIASNVISPLLLPALVLVFMPPEKKNTSTALVYVTGLAVAMFIQHVMGMRSDRSTSTVKSTCPGVSMILMTWPFHPQVVAADIMVMPRSFSCSMKSMVAAPSSTSPIRCTFPV